MPYTLQLATGGLLGVTNTTLTEITGATAIASTDLVETRIYLVGGSSDYTITLPDSGNGLEDGVTIRFVYQATGIVTIDADANDVKTIDGNNTLILEKDLDVIYDGTNWVTFNSSVSLADSATNVAVVDRTDSDSVSNLQFEIIASDGTPTGAGFISLRKQGA